MFSCHLQYAKTFLGPFCQNKQNTFDVMKKSKSIKKTQKDKVFFMNMTIY